MAPPLNITLEPLDLMKIKEMLGKKILHSNEGTNLIFMLERFNKTLQSPKRHQLWNVVNIFGDDLYRTAQWPYVHQKNTDGTERTDFLPKLSVAAFAIFQQSEAHGVTKKGKFYKALLKTPMNKEGEASPFRISQQAKGISYNLTAYPSPPFKSIPPYKKGDFLASLLRRKLPLHRDGRLKRRTQLLTKMAIIEGINQALKERPQRIQNLSDYLIVTMIHTGTLFAERAICLADKLPPLEKGQSLQTARSVQRILTSLPKTKKISLCIRDRPAMYNRFCDKLNELGKNRFK